MALLLPDQVGTADLRIGDRDHALGGGERDLLVGGADELAGEAARSAARRTGSGWRERTRARRPMKRRKWAGLVSGRSLPGEETSSE